MWIQERGVADAVTPLTSLVSLEADKGEILSEISSVSVGDVHLERVGSYILPVALIAE